MTRVVLLCHLVLACSAAAPEPDTAVKETALADASSIAHARPMLESLISRFREWKARPSLRAHGTILLGEPSPLRAFGSDSKDAKQVGSFILSEGPLTSFGHGTSNDDTKDRRVGSSFILSESPLTSFGHGTPSEDTKESQVDKMFDNDHPHEPTAQEKQTVVEWQAQVDKLGAIIHHALHADHDAVWASDLESLKNCLKNLMSSQMKKLSGHDNEVFAIRRVQLEKLEEALHDSPNAHFQTGWDKLGSSLFELRQMRVLLEFEMKEHATATPQKMAERHGVDLTQDISSSAAHNIKLLSV